MDEHQEETFRAIQRAYETLRHACALLWCSVRFRSTDLGAVIPRSGVTMIRRTRPKMASAQFARCLCACSLMRACDMIEPFPDASALAQYTTPAEFYKLAGDVFRYDHLI